MMVTVVARVRARARARERERERGREREEEKRRKSVELIRVRDNTPVGRSCVCAIVEMVSVESRRELVRAGKGHCRLMPEGGKMILSCPLSFLSTFFCRFTFAPFTASPRLPPVRPPSSQPSLLPAFAATTPSLPLTPDDNIAWPLR